MSDFRSPHEKQAESKRMMLAIGVSLAVMFSWNAIFPPTAPQQPQAASAEQFDDESRDKTAADPSPSGAIAPQQNTPGIAAETATEEAPVVVIPAKTFRLEDSRRIVTLSNVGAHPVGVQLVDQAHSKIYKEPGTEADRPAVDLAAGRADFGSLELAGLKTDQVWKVESSNDKQVVFSTRAGSLELRRSWSLAEHGLSHSLSLHALSASTGKVGLKLSMIDPGLGGSMFSGPPDLPRAFCHDGEELQAEFASDLDDEDSDKQGTAKPYLFGVDRNFFAVAFSGEEAANCRFDLRNAAPKKGEEKPLQIVVASAERDYELGAGARMQWDNTLYLVPKSDDLLASIDAALRDVIDFGIFKFIAQPMLLLLTFYFSLLGNYGLAIILLTFTVKLLLWPITDMSFRSMARMKEIQPRIAELREKYKADKQTLAQKQMEMFKAEGVNPAGGCLPMLLQIPVWFALYSTLRVAVELYGSPFIPGWLDDLTLADPLYILPALLGVVFFMQQKLQPQMTDNPQQQMMMKVMPVMMTVFMVALPCGLVVYILVNTVLGIGHQYYAIKRDAKRAR